MGRKIRIIDVTMRDGTHAMGYHITPEKMAEIAAGLEACGVDTIEVGHGFGCGASSINYGRLTYPDSAYYTAVAHALKKAKADTLVLPGAALLDDIDAAYDDGLRMFRVATHCTLGDCGEQYIRYCKSKNVETFGFLMMAHMSTLENIVLQAKNIESYGADGVYITDSAGAMLPSQVTEFVKAVKAAVSIKVGFHGHNNLGLAIANSLAAAEAGADCIDATVCGMGAASGNAQLEVLVGVLKKAGFETGIDLFKVMDLAEQVVRPIMTHPQFIDNPAFIIGYAGTYGAFYNHALEVGKNYGVDPRDILLELGRRGAVGGQDDMILEVGVQLAEQKKKQKSK